MAVVTAAVMEVAWRVVVVEVVVAVEMTAVTAVA